MRGDRARRRLGVEGGAARSSRSCSSCARAARLPFDGRVGRLARARLRRVRRRSTRCCRRAGSAAARRTTACCSALRHDLAAGRRVLPRPRPRPDACASCGGSRATILATAVGVAAFGLIDIYAIPLSWWRDSGAPGWFRDQLGFDYQRPLGPAGELHLQHRERASAAAARLDVPLAARDARTCSWSRCSLAPRGWPRAGCAAGWLLVGAVALLFAGAALDALALVVPRARARPRRASRCVRRAVACGRRSASAVRGRRASASPSSRLYPHIGAARRRFTPRELEGQQRARTRIAAAPAAAVSGVDGREHREPLAEPAGGVATVLRHPQGFGLGNAGSTAARTRRRRSRPASRPTPSSASRRASLGGLVFVAWSLALLRARAPLHAWLGAVARRGARARAADRRDRRAVARLRASGRSRAAVLATAAVGSHGSVTTVCQNRTRPCARARSSVPWIGCASRSSISSSRCSSRRSSLAALTRCGGGGSAALGRRSPSPTLTPGALNPDVTQATIGSDDLRPRLDADRPPAVELHVGAQGRADGAVRAARLAVRLPGGPPDQPRARRRSRPTRATCGPSRTRARPQVDRIENELNAKVCSGELTLAEAQRAESALKHEHG